MLTLYRGVIAYHDIAPVQTRAAVNREPIAHRHADGIGDEDRHPPGALRNEFTLRTHEPHRKIFVLVNIGAEGGARNVGIDLIRDRDQTVANHLQGDRIDRRLVQVGFKLPFMCVSLLPSGLLITPPSPRRGRNEEGVLNDFIHVRSTPILTFPRQGGRYSDCVRVF
jgi:hypothetical protein